MNYLKHETKVRYGDGLLAHSQDWQWMINELEENFELIEINSWEQYLQECGVIQTLFGYFVKILGVCDKKWIYSKKGFEEIWEIAKFYHGSISVGECIDKLSFNQCKLFFLCVWITKLENSDNEFEYLYDVRLLTQKNYFELIKCDSLLEYEKEIENYINTISVSGLENPLKNLSDNLNQVEYPCNPEFLQCHAKEILNYNSFSFQSIHVVEGQTWQEIYLLDMLKVSFRNREIHPMAAGNNVMIPDISKWDINILNRLQKYFCHVIADFIIESIAYVRFHVEPSHKIKIMHCKLLLDAIDLDEKNYEIFSSSSYCILSYLYQDKCMKECNKDEMYINLIKKIQKWNDPILLNRIKNDGFPISKEQRKCLTEYLTNKFKQIENVNMLSELIGYLKSHDITKKITTEYLQKVSDKFKIYTEKNSDVVTASAYYEYLVFLIKVNQTNPDIDKRLLQKEMLYIQKIWQENAFERQCESLHRFSHEQKIKRKDLERFCDLAILNPIVFAKSCTPSSEKEILKIMSSISENVFSHLCNRIALTPIFPKKADKIIYERHDIDIILLQYVKKLINEKGYKLLNVFKAEEFVSGIHEQYKMQTRNALGLFIKEEELYNVVKNETNIELLPYTNSTSLALVTQLFPVLEMKIRDLVTLFGIFPFKMNLDEFMQYNDPSSLLRELLMMIFKEQQSFENVPDLIYVYNIMYNGNSCNVRNECIHGRDYLSGGSFKFAFKATLFAIHMIEFRIKTIKDNVSDIMEMA